MPQVPPRRTFLKTAAGATLGAALLPRRPDPPLLEARHAIRSGALGPIVFCHIFHAIAPGSWATRFCLPTAESPATEWRMALRAAEVNSEPRPKEAVDGAPSTEYPWAASEEDVRARFLPVRTAPRLGQPEQRRDHQGAVRPGAQPASSTQRSYPLDTIRFLFDLPAPLSISTQPGPSGHLLLTYRYPGLIAAYERRVSTYSSRIAIHGTRGTLLLDQLPSYMEV